MNDPIEPIRHKMTEAIPPAPDDAPDPHERTGDHEHLKAGMKEHNASVHPASKDRLVDMGRGDQTKGRGSQSGSH